MPPKRRRRTRSSRLPTLVLFVLGLGCVITALALWLLTPDRGPVAGIPPTAVRTATAERAVPAEPTAAAVGVTPTDRAAEEPTTITAPTEAPTAPPATTASITPERPSPTPEPTASAAAPLATPRLGAPAGGRPRLAIIIDDCGQWPVTERGFVALPFPVTLSVLPHVRYGPEIARVADEAGKGVMLHLPMQTVSGRYPGPGTITVSMSDDAIRSMVAGDLAELPQARGVNNHEGSLATANRRVMGDVIDVLQRENRYFIDSRTSAASVGEDVARARGVPAAARDVFLDNVDDEAAVEAQLRHAAAEATENGTAIAIGHPRPATLDAVRALGPVFIAQGIELTFASDLVH